MNVTPHPTPDAPTPGHTHPTRSDDLAMAALAGAGLVLTMLLSHLGFAWDIMWHQDVGPDTFFTAPHLMVYAGGATTGLLALGVVLVLTWRARTTARHDVSSVPLLRGRFHGPLGVAIAGWGAVVFLVAGLYDQWWHLIYGFDAVLDSPPHIALGLADIFVHGGTIVLLTMVVTRTEDGGYAPWIRRVAIGALATAAAVFVTGSQTYQTILFGAVVAGVDLSLVLVAAAYAFVLVMVAGAVRRPGAATLVGLSFTALYVLDWAFATWATGAYADALGLFPRDDAAGYPLLVALMPKFVLPAGLAIDAVLLVARRRGGSVLGGVLAASAAGAAVLVGSELVVPGLPAISVTDPRPLVGVVAVLCAAVAGAVGGWAGWRVALRLRRLPGTAHAHAAAAVTGARR